MRRAYFNFYESFYRAASECGLSDEERLAFYDAMCAWAFDGEEPELHGAVKVAFMLARPNIEASPGLRENRGGRPRKGGEATSETPSETPSETTCVTDSETAYGTDTETQCETALETPAKTGFETQRKTSPSMKGKGRGSRKKGSSPKELPPSPPPTGAAPGGAAPPGECPRCGSFLIDDGGRLRCPGCTASFDRGEAPR